MGIQDMYKTIGDSGCLIMCDMVLAGIEPKDLIFNFEPLVDNRIIGIDCFIYDHDALLAFFGCDKEYIVTDKAPIDLPYIANYKYNGFNHFVVEKDGKIIFNSLEDSKCVNYGVKEQKFRYLK